MRFTEFWSERKKIQMHKELSRKVWHLLEVPELMLFAYLAKTYSEDLALMIATGCLLIIMHIEYLRVEYKMKLPSYFQWIIRDKEKNQLSGVTYYLIAMIISFAIFEYPIAMTAMLFATFGDLAAALFGIAFGKRKIIHNKTWVGFIAGLITNYIVAFIFLFNYPGIFIPMVIVASLVELFTQKLDDNLTIPLYSGFVGQIIILVAGLQF